ncbi:hypothetical protein BD289DRAFT_275406 [Coniella lustricola]|uniref:Uncharacterized protein n=1 Tax=Coniella lustricola TaxID=2025994 RepID=A0A2T3A6Q9_9PEZI|nr:hypothetical protein BD289DRAFT_275406 [Coniella lustricola]
MRRSLSCDLFWTQRIPVPARYVMVWARSATALRIVFGQSFRIRGHGNCTSSGAVPFVTCCSLLLHLPWAKRRLEEAGFLLGSRRPPMAPCGWNSAGQRFRSLRYRKSPLETTKKMRYVSKGSIQCCAVAHRLYYTSAPQHAALCCSRPQGLIISLCHVYILMFHLEQDVHVPVSWIQGTLDGALIHQIRALPPIWPAITIAHKQLHLRPGNQPIHIHLLPQKHLLDLAVIMSESPGVWGVARLL